MPWKKRHTAIVLSLLAITAAAITLKTCKGYKGTKAPVAVTDTIPIKVPLSHFHIPISYSYQQLEQLLNGKIKGAFLETIVQPTKNEKDRVKVVIKKLSAIKIGANGNKLAIRLPLEVTATIVNSRINFLTKGIKPVTTQLELVLHTPVNLNSQWQLVTRFSFVSLRWIKEPVVKIAGIPINLTKTLDKLIANKKDDLCKLLDTEITKAVSLKTPIEKIWFDLQKPIAVSKKMPVTYLRFFCYSIAGDLRLSPAKIICHTSIEAKVVMVSMSELKRPVKPFPPFRKKDYTTPQSDVHVFAFAAFTDINDRLNEKLAGKTFTAKKLSASIDTVEAFAVDSGIAVKVKTKGDLDATITASFRPKYDSATQQLHLKKPQFNITTDNMLVNAGDALLHEKILEEVKGQLKIGLDSLITKIPDLIGNALAKGKTGQTIDVTLNDFIIHSCIIKQDSRYLFFFVHTTFQSALRIKKINTGKRIKILPKRKKA